MHFSTPARVLAAVLALAGGGAAPAEEVSEEFIETYRAYDKAYAAGELERARELAAEALRIGRRELGTAHEKVGVLAVNLGHVLQLTGHHAEAESVLLEARKILVQAGGDRHPALGTVYEDLARVRAALGRHDEARAAYDEALALLRAESGASTPAEASLLMEIAAFEQTRGAVEAALAALEKAYAIRLAAFGVTDPRVGDVLYRRGHVHLTADDLRAAELALVQALENWQAAVPDDHERLFRAHGALAGVYDALGDEAAFARHRARLLDHVPDREGDAVPLLITYPRVPEPATGAGSVLLGFTVAETGDVRDAQVIESVPAGVYDAVSLEAARRWLFRPRVHDGRRVPQPGIRARLVFRDGQVDVQLGTVD